MRYLKNVSTPPLAGVISIAVGCYIAAVKLAGSTRMMHLLVETYHISSARFCHNIAPRKFSCGFYNGKKSDKNDRAIELLKMDFKKFKSIKGCGNFDSERCMRSKLKHLCCTTRPGS